MIAHAFSQTDFMSLLASQFWNVKLTSKFRATPANSTDPSTVSMLGDVDGVPEEHKETAETLRAKQLRMEGQVEQIWRVLSAFEESSAACISEMLRFVSAGQYAEAILMAERFILHVEILFAAIDDLEAQFAQEGAKGEPMALDLKAFSQRPANKINAQVCLTLERQRCCVGRRSTSSPCSRTRKIRPSRRHR